MECDCDLPCCSCPTLLLQASSLSSLHAEVGWLTRLALHLLIIIVYHLWKCIRQCHSSNWLHIASGNASLIHKMSGWWQTVVMVSTLCSFRLLILCVVMVTVDHTGVQCRCSVCEEKGMSENEQLPVHFVQNKMTNPHSIMCGLV